MAFTQLYSDEQTSEGNTTTKFINDSQSFRDLEKSFENFEEAKKQLLYAITNNSDSYITGVEPLVLFGLLHARYIRTEQGLRQLYKKVIEGKFGQCMRQGCSGAFLAPSGVSDIPGQSPFCVFCYNCKQQYRYVGYDEVDSSFFGQDIAHLLLLRFPNICEKLQSNCKQKDERMECGQRLFGFEICYDKIQPRDRKVQ